MTTISATNIAGDVTEKQVKDFFSFCGKIADISLSKDPANPTYQKADITFERAGAAKTALLLQDAQLGSSKIKLAAEHPISESQTGGGAAAETTSGKETNLDQDEKPRTAIAAELLSHGYVLGDSAVQKSIEFDQKNGVSSRFYSFLNSTVHTVDDTLGITDRSKAVDDKFNITEKSQGAVKNISDRSQDAYKGIHQYFEDALDTSAGRTVREFYNKGQKTVLDIHTEARRLADLREGKQTDTEEAAGSASGAVKRD